MPDSRPRRIYLASRSPRRRELLLQIGVEFDTLAFRSPPRDDDDVCEDVLDGERVEDYVVRVTLAKAEAGLRRLNWRSQRKQPLLAADTTLDLDGEIIGKPRDEAHAAEILGKLSGRPHRVLTAVAVAEDDRLEYLVNTSLVRFRELSSEDIRRYIRTREPFDKAGAYGIQGHAGAFIAEIQGSYTGIMGLPLYETAQLLGRFGIVV